MTPSPEPAPGAEPAPPAHATAPSAPRPPRTVDVLTSLRHALTSIERWASRRPTWERLGAESVGLTRTDVWLLERLAECGYARMSELAGWQSVDRSTITVQVKRLEGNGLIARDPDPADRRAVQVSLTRNGRSAMEDHARRMSDTMDRLISAWEPDDVADFSRLLARFAQALDEDLENAAEEPRRDPDRHQRAGHGEPAVPDRSEQPDSRLA